MDHTDDPVVRQPPPPPDIVARNRGWDVLPDGAGFNIDDCDECYVGCRCTAHVLWGRDKAGGGAAS